MTFSSMLAGLVLGLLVFLVTEAAADEADKKVLEKLVHYDTKAPKGELVHRKQVIFSQLWNQNKTEDFKGPGQNAVEIQKRGITWIVFVETGNIRHAGTDASVFIKLAGENGETEAVELDDEHDNFEQNAMDLFYVTLPDVGRLVSLTVWHNNAGAYAGWYLEEISMSYEIYYYKFPCKSWLEGDALSKTLYPI